MAITGEIKDQRILPETANRSCRLTRDVGWGPEGETVTFGAQITFDTTEYLVDADGVKTGIFRTGTLQQVAQLSQEQLYGIYGIPVTITETGVQTSLGQLLADKLDEVIGQIIGG